MEEALDLSFDRLLMMMIMMMMMIYIYIYNDGVEHLMSLAGRMQLLCTYMRIHKILS